MIKNRLTLPLVPLRGLTVFPGMALHFDVGRPKSIAAVRRAMDADKLVFLCYQNDISIDHPRQQDLAKIGTIAEIRQILNLPDGNIRILVDGIHRGRITRFTDQDQLVEVIVSRLEDIACEDDLHVQVLVRRLFHLVEKFLELYDRLSPEAVTSLLSIEEPGEMADVVISNFPVKPQLKQEILDEISVSSRLEKLIDIIANETDILEIEKKIMDKVQASLDQNQREYVLREKMKVIQEELGEGDAAEAEVAIGGGPDAPEIENVKSASYTVELSGVTARAQVSYIQTDGAYYILTIHPDSMSLDTYAAPNNGTTDKGPQSDEFKKLPSYQIPMD